MRKSWSLSKGRHPLERPACTAAARLWYHASPKCSGLTCTSAGTYRSGVTATREACRFMQQRHADASAPVREAAFAAASAAASANADGGNPQGYRSSLRDKLPREEGAAPWEVTASVTVASAALLQQVSFL